MRLLPPVKGQCPAIGMPGGCLLPIPVTCNSFSEGKQLSIHDCCCPICKGQLYCPLDMERYAKIAKDSYTYMDSCNSSYRVPATRKRHAVVVFGWRLGIVAFNIYLDCTSFRPLIVHYAGKKLLWMHRNA
ncbi:hypothetical protein CEXT_735981 [Caerostris extrusa]|uniref:Uncharacterized protein n=1 Tax=Caerostris extrusa TaxID=172846 RepID=A0AAV4YDC2_CAEEX|nr:hypothetical protein CEXT_735981 [Caerostris extrusa]